MKQIVKNFNNLVNKTIFKVKNKTNNKFIISNFNKYLIAFIALLFFYLFYLLIPLSYNKGWVQNSIDEKFLNEFKINLSTSSDISYRILPAPHFLIKNSKILLEGTKNKKSIADIKILKVFLNQKNFFFSKEKMAFKKATINEANFSLLVSDIKILNDMSNNEFSNKKITFNDSNVFLKNNLGEIITIIKINKAILFFDDKKLLNLFNLKGEAFAVPFIFDFENRNDPIKNKKINFRAKSLKLNILNESINDNSSSTGNNVISIFNSKIKTKYNIKEQLITFTSNDSIIKNSKIIYNGNLSINPFDLNLRINLGNYKISKLFYPKSTLIEFLKSELLFNDNISLKTSVIANSSLKDEFFNNAKINFNIINGKINFNNTKFINNKIGLIKLDNSNLFLENEKLILNTDILINIKDQKRLFLFLNTDKQSRKNIKNILINLDFDFLSNQIKFNNIEVDDKKVSNEFFNIIEGFNNFGSNNLNKSRRLINKLFNAYDG